MSRAPRGRPSAHAHAPRSTLATTRASESRRSSLRTCSPIPRRLTVRSEPAWRTAAPPFNDCDRLRRHTAGGAAPMNALTKVMLKRAEPGCTTLSQILRTAAGIRRLQPLRAGVGAGRGARRGARAAHGRRDDRLRRHTRSACATRRGGHAWSSSPMAATAAASYRPRRASQREQAQSRLIETRKRKRGSRSGSSASTDACSRPRTVRCSRRQARLSNCAQSSPSGARTWCICPSFSKSMDHRATSKVLLMPSPVPTCIPARRLRRVDAAVPNCLGAHRPDDAAREEDALAKYASQLAEADDLHACVF